MTDQRAAQLSNNNRLQQPTGPQEMFNLRSTRHRHAIRNRHTQIATIITKKSSPRPSLCSAGDAIKPTHTYTPLTSPQHPCPHATHTQPYTCYCQHTATLVTKRGDNKSQPPSPPASLPPCSTTTTGTTQTASIDASVALPPRHSPSPDRCPQKATAVLQELSLRQRGDKLTGALNKKKNMSRSPLLARITESPGEPLLSSGSHNGVGVASSNARLHYNF